MIRGGDQGPMCLLLRKQGSTLIRTFGLRSILILLVLIAVIPVFAIVMQASLSEQRGQLARNEESLRSLADLGVAYQEQLVEGARQILVTVAQSPPVFDPDPQACAGYFRQLQDKYPRYTNLGLLDERGELICRGVPGNQPVSAGDRLFFRQAVSTGAFSAGEFVIGRASGRPSLSFGLPVYRPDQSLRGVLFVGLDLRHTDAQLRKVAIPQGATLLVTDANAVVLASAGAAPLPIGTRVADRFLRERILSGRARHDIAPGEDGQDWLYAVRPVDQAGAGRMVVSALASQASVLAPAAQRLYRQLGALALVTVLAALAAWLFGDRVLVRPLSRLLARVEALRLGAPGQAAPQAAPEGSHLRELARLDQGFVEMAGSLAERAAQRDAALAEVVGQRNLLESVFQNTADGVLVFDATGHLKHMNGAALRIAPGLDELNREREPLGVGAAQWGLFQMDGKTLLPPAEWPSERALAGQVFEGVLHLARGRLVGGGEKILRTSGQPLHEPDGASCGALVVFSDVTGAWRAEQALRDSERRYRKLFEANPHPGWVYDTRTLRFLAVNDAAVVHYGYSQGQFLSMTIEHIRPQEDLPLLYSAMRQQESVAGLGDGLKSPLVWRHQRSDGELIFVEVSSYALEFDGRPARMVLTHDITARLQAQQALQLLNGSLERRVAERTRELAMSNKELESFSYSVSHDLRAPLQVIDGFGRALMSRHADGLDPQALHYLRRIRENTRHMSQLIDDLLSLARVTRAEIHAEPCNLAPRARQVVEGLRARFPERQVQVELDEDMGATCDPRLLGVVLENLIENAWKFTERTSNAWVRIGRRAGEDGEPVFYVADNGAGFDPTYADKLFTAFQRLHSATEFQGTGIGLATVHRIVTRHGGRVWAEGAPDQGALFQFTLKGINHDEKKPNPAGGGQPGPPGAHADDPGREQCTQ